MTLEIELFCPDCESRFAASARTPHEEIVERMTDEGPWYALGEGEFFQDMIHTALSRRGWIACPACRRALLVHTMETVEVND
jgi:hypothetical protein